MTRSELEKIAAGAKCRTYGVADAPNGGHRITFASLMAVFNSSESLLLCEPSLQRKSGTADIVLLDPEIGVHVFEVKAHSLEQIDRVDPGGQIWFRYGSQSKPKKPLLQARDAMFVIKDRVGLRLGGGVNIPFEFWAVFPSFTRADWMQRFGPNAFNPPELLFKDDLIADRLRSILLATAREGSNQPIRLCSLEHLQAVHDVFGDTMVLYTRPEDRAPREIPNESIGARFDRFADADKRLSIEQKRLSEMDWDGGPRQIRGVAGSGKTVVLANNLGRFLRRRLADTQQTLLAGPNSKPRILAVCYNRTLVPYLLNKIKTAYSQRSDEPFPRECVDVVNFNALMYRLGRAGLLKYRNVEDAKDIVFALDYLRELESSAQQRPDQLEANSFDAIYVDEGQDLFEDEFRLLIKLCRPNQNGEPNLYVFYDDAQNLYGRTRPNWKSLGLNVRGGRSFVMTQCHRNSQQTLEPAFNVLYGTAASLQSEIPAKEFGDVANLENEGQIQKGDGLWRLKFAPRQGPSPRIRFANGVADENEHILQRLRFLIEKEQVRPEDILVLTYRKARVLELTNLVRAAGIRGVQSVFASSEDRDHSLNMPGQLTFSTVNSAKGYDAAYVLLASANDFRTDVSGRATFYVGCTRAIHVLEVSASARSGLALELEAVLQRLRK